MPAPPQPRSSPGKQPRGEVVAAGRDRAEIGLWIVQGIVEELRELLRERLDVLILHDGWSVAQKGPEHEGVAGGGVDAVCSPGAAYGCVGVGVVGGVVGDGDDQCAVLTRNLLEELLLEKLRIHNTKRCAGLLRREQIAVTERE